MGKKKSDIWYHYTEILLNRAKWSALSMQDLYRSKCSKNEKQRSLLVKKTSLLVVVKDFIPLKRGNMDTGFIKEKMEIFHVRQIELKHFMKNENYAVN